MGSQMAILSQSEPYCLFAISPSENASKLESMAETQVCSSWHK